MRPLVQVVADKVEVHGSGSLTIHRAKWDIGISGRSQGEFDVMFAMELEAEDSGRDIEYCVRLINPDGRFAESMRTKNTLPLYDPLDGTPIYTFIERFNLILDAAGNYEFALVEFLEGGDETQHGYALLRAHQSN